VETLPRSCPFRKSYPDVLVVQSSQDRNGDDSARSLSKHFFCPQANRIRDVARG
jgi:hypothetical protein